MTNVERVENLSYWCKDTSRKCHKEMIGMLDDSNKKQREADIKALRNVCQHFMGHSFNTGSLVLLEDAILNATGDD